MKLKRMGSKYYVLSLYKEIRFTYTSQRHGSDDHIGIHFMRIGGKDGEPYGGRLILRSHVLEFIWKPRINH